MKIVKIKKDYRNGTREHFLVLFNEPYLNDDIDCLVEEWCDSEPSGMSWGYTYEWEFVKDTELINKILKDKIKGIDYQIEMLNAKKCEMENHIIVTF